MKTRLLTIAALAISVTFAGSALAQPVTAPVTFADVDTNADGMLTLEEIRAVYSNATQEDFDRVNMDFSDGLNPEEFAALIPFLETGATPPAGSNLAPSR